MSAVVKANQDYPITIDVVFAYDRALVDQLQALSAREWRQRQNDIRLAFPTDIQVDSYEVVPAQKPLVRTIPERAVDALAAFVFVHYRSDGMHRARVDDLERFAILLGEKDFSIEPRS